MIGRSLGDFVIRERIGGGGSGEVFRAEQLSLGREAVIKVLERSRVVTAEAADRFLREARLASRLEHPFAAHVYAFGAEADGLLWIAMELVRGTPLDRLIKTQGPLPLPRFVAFFERLAEVLHAAHEQGIVHRDVKPANVMVINHAGRLLPKLLDLGIARVQGTAPASDELSRVSLDQLLSDDPTSVLISGRTPNLLGDPTVTSPPTLEPVAKTDPRLTKMLSQRMLLSEELELTGIGGVVGTPHFMAPEQWADASRADARSDQYSLAILSFEAITGRLPFHAKSIRAMAKAHAKMPLPALGDGLPDALHATLSRGAAKKPEHRFANALEFAAAVRAASGVGVEPVSLPQLDERLRENVLAEAPQPLADAIALLDASRTARQAVEAVASVHRVAVRYLGVLALASRARVGSGAPTDSLEVSTLVSKLAGGSLETLEWLQLAKELCRPFATLPEAHVLPELVSFFFNRTGQSTESVRPLMHLAELSWPPSDAPEDVQVAFLLQAVPAVGHLLSAISFVYDYPLVVHRADAERWMGTRRVRRAPQEVLATNKHDGDVVLVNAAGGGVVSLTPLLQVISPSVGATEELFFLDGTGRFGARLAALPGPFERQDPNLWPWFSEHIINVGESLASRADGDAEPYKGLSTFTPQDADNYFGREREAQGFANRLRNERLLAVVGPSGAGKSSFILAGVLPLLPKGFRPLVFRPGSSPTAALKARLAAEGLQPAYLGADLLNLALPPDQTLVLVVDQFEELVTLCADLEERKRFAELLTTAADAPDGRLRVVVTLRDDFLIKIQQLEAFRERLSGSLQLLGTPATEDLLRVVTEPARRVGYGFDDDQLPKRMVEAVAEYSSALALLSFTASQLWQMRDRHLHQMRAKTYDALGGVGGALAHHAEATLSPLPPGEQKLVREAFRQLVTGQGTRAVLSRKEVLEVLGNDDRAQHVLDTLVNARLLVTSESASGEDQVEIIHEALIISWPRLVGWLREDAETARLRDALRSSARQWEERKRPRGLLWRDETLTEYRLWRSRFAGHLTSSEADFAAASLREELRGQVIRRTLAGIAIASLVVGLVVIFRAYQAADASFQKAEANAEEAHRRVAGLRQEQGRQAMLNDKPLEALAYLDAARAAGASGYAVDHMLKMATWQSRGEIARYEIFGPPKGGALSGDGRLVAIGAQTQVNVLDVESGAVRAKLEVPGGAMAFSPDGRLAIGNRAGQVVFFDASTGAPKEQWAIGTKPILNIEFTNDGALAAVSVLGGESKVVRSDGSVMTKLDFGGAGSTLRFSPEGTQVAAFLGAFETSQESLRNVRLVDLKTQVAWLDLKNLSEPANGVAFDGSGRVVVVGYGDGRIVGYRREPPKRGKFAPPLWQLNAHRGRLLRLVTSPDGRTMMSLGADGRARFFEPLTGKVITTAELSAGILSFGVWAPDSRSAYIATPDGAVHRINATTGERLWKYPALSGLTRLVLTPSGRGLMNWMVDGSTRLLDADLSSGDVQLPGAKVEAVLGVAASPVQPVLTSQGWLGLALDGGVRLVPEPLTHNITEGWAEVSRDGSLYGAVHDGRVRLMRLVDERYVFEAEISAKASLGLFALGDTGHEFVAQTEEGDLLIYRGSPLVQTATIRAEGDGKVLGPFSSDGNTIVTATNSGLIEKYDTTTGAKLASTRGGTGFFSLHPLLQLDRVMTLTDQGRIEIWQASTMTKLASSAGKGMLPLAVNLDADGALLNIWLPDGFWETWDLATDAPLSRVSVLGVLASVGISPTGALVAGVGGTLIRAPLSTPIVSAQLVDHALRCATPFTLMNDRLERRAINPVCLRR